MYSVAIMAETSENARNFILIADGVLKTIGRRYFSENARNSNFAQKEPENARKLTKIGKKLADF